MSRISEDGEVMMVVDVRGLAHIALFVRDMDRSIRFYTDVLSFTQQYYQDRQEMK